MTTSSNVLRVLAPHDGTVRVIVAASPALEREIARERGDITQTLHAAYMTLTEAMAPFQQRWDANPQIALIDGVIEGAKDGGATWLAEQADMFERRYWEGLYQSAEKNFAESFDKLAIYGKQQFKDIQREVSKLVAHPQDTLLNWSFYEAKYQQHSAAQAQYVAELQAQAEATVRAVAAGARRAGLLYQHRAAIMNLPLLVAHGDPIPIQAFVEHELMEIDPELAREIRGDPRFAIVLEVLADHESVLTFLAYASMMFDAIPPNFYGYIAGKGAMYLICEVILLIVTALLSAGAAAAGRIALLVARIGASSVRISGATRKYQHARLAVNAFTRVVEDLHSAMMGLHRLGPKVRRSRNRGVVAEGTTGSRLDMKKDSIKRDGRCRICGSASHRTPKNRRGTVKYE